MYKCIADVYYSLCCCCICFLGGWARRRDDWERRLNHARGRDVPILHRGIETHDMACVRQLVKRQKTRAEQKKLVNTCLIYGGGTALHVACRKTTSTTGAAATTAKTSSKPTSAVDMVRCLVHTCGADVEGTDEPDQCTALHVALQNSHFDLVQYLVKRCRANVNAQNKRGQSCLHYACRYGTIALVRYILLECVRQTAHTLHCLDQAVATSRVIEARDTDGHTALHMACLQDSDGSNSLEIARYLVETGSASMVHDVDKEGMTPLHQACFTGGQSSTELVQFLVDIGHAKDTNGLIDKVDHHGNTALHWACASTMINLETVRYLVETMGRTTTDDNASRDGTTATRQVAFLQCTNQEGQTALHKAAVAAAGNGGALALVYLDVIQYLVQTGVDANARDTNGCTALDCLKATLKASKNHPQHRDDSGVKNVVEYLESVTTCTSYTARLWNYLSPTSSSSSPKPSLTASESSDTSPV